MTRPSLVLVPGLQCDAALWSHQEAALSDIAQVTVADVTAEDTIEGMARAVLSAAPERFALAGLSMGGYVAQDIMRRAPERVSRLALISTTPGIDTPAAAQQRQDLIRLSRRGRFIGISAQRLHFLIHPDRLNDHDLTTTVQTMAKRVGRETFIRQQTAILGRKDGREDLKKIRCPTLVMCGREDAITPVEVHEAMAAAIPGAKLVIVEDSGHLIPLERPHATSAVLRYWLQENAVDP